MIILLTNDDGIKSPKLHITKDVLKEFGTVYTVAPRHEQSGKGMSLSIGGFHFEQRDEFLVPESAGVPIGFDMVFVHGGILHVHAFGIPFTIESRNAIYAPMRVDSKLCVLEPIGNLVLGK